MKREDDAKLQEAGKEWAAKHKGIRGLSRKDKDAASAETATGELDVTGTNTPVATSPEEEEGQVETQVVLHEA